MNARVEGCPGLKSMLGIESGVVAERRFGETLESFDADGKAREMRGAEAAESVSSSMRWVWVATGGPVKWDCHIHRWMKFVNG